MVRTFALITLLGIMAGTSLAQSIDKPAYELERTSDDNNSNRDNDEKFFIEDYRGRLLMLYFWRPTNLESIEELRDVKKILDQYQAEGLAAIAICTESKDRFDDWLDDQENDPTAGFRHTAWNFRGFQHHWGAVSEPLCVLIDPRGILRWRGHPNDNVGARIERLLERYPARAADEQWLQGRLRAAQVWLDRGDFGRAYTFASQVEVFTNDGGDGSAINAQALSLKSTIETEAEKQLKEAVRLEQDGDLEEAAKIVAEVSVRFDNGETDQDKQVEVAKQAQQEIGRMNGRREMKETIRDAVTAAKAQVEIDKAQDLESTNQYEQALAVYEQMLEDFEDTDAEKDAKRAIIRIGRDKEIQKVIASNRAERMADRYLDIGERYSRNQMYEEAREAFKTLLAEYPKSNAAKLAKDALDDLPA